jgi:hypothetical protein
MRSRPATCPRSPCTRWCRTASSTWPPRASSRPRSASASRRAPAGCTCPSGMGETSSTSTPSPPATASTCSAPGSTCCTVRPAGFAVQGAAGGKEVSISLPLRRPE